MSRLPARYTAREIATWHVSEEYEPGCWRPARPCGIYRSWRSWEGYVIRWKSAWSVLTGRCDILDWGDNSGEWDNSQVKYRDITEKGFVRAGRETQS